ncbi:hypothetical protein SARC_16892, partial [Sphaeroforma arctica JP610]
MFVLPSNHEINLLIPSNQIPPISSLRLETEKANRALAENKVNELSAAAATAQATQEAQLVRIKASVCACVGGCIHCALQSDYSALKESTATLTTQLTIAHTTITNMGSEHDVIL